MYSMKRASRTLRNVVFAFAATCGASAFAYDPVDCLNDIAKADPEITVGLATKLCSGAWTPEPVKCYLGASKIDHGIIRGITIDLCAGTTQSENTLACYARNLRPMLRESVVEDDDIDLNTVVLSKYRLSNSKI